MSDARFDHLGLVVNVEGFVKYSQIYRGNIAAPSTLESTVESFKAVKVEINLW